MSRILSRAEAWIAFAAAAQASGSPFGPGAAAAADLLLAEAERRGYVPRAGGAARAPRAADGPAMPPVTDGAPTVPLAAGSAVLSLGPGGLRLEEPAAYAPGPEEGD